MEKQSEIPPLYKAISIIETLDADAHVKHLLITIARHTQRSEEHPKHGLCWYDEEDLGKFMSLSRSSVQRAVKAADGKWLEVKRVRHGKRPSEQHNEYRIRWEAMPLSVTQMPDTEVNETLDDENMPQIDPEQASNSGGTGVKNEPNKRQADAIGFEVGSKGSKKRATQRSAASAATAISSDRQGESLRLTSWKQKGWSGSSADLSRVEAVLERLGSSGMNTNELRFHAWLADPKGGLWLAGKTKKRLDWLADRMESTDTRCAADQFVDWCVDLPEVSTSLPEEPVTYSLDGPIECDDCGEEIRNCRCDSKPARKAASSFSLEDC